MRLDNELVGNIVTTLPGATAVFFNNKINFCSRSNMTLADALKENNCNSEAVYAALTELDETQEGLLEFDTYSNEQVIDHIIERFHKVHREQFPELLRLAQRVENTHALHPFCPKGLYQHLSQMFNELEQHMQKEENILFPMLAQEQFNMARGPIRVMLQDHDGHIEEINTIFALTRNLELHSDACNSWKALYLGLQAFINDVYTHIYIENNILFTPR